MTSTRLESAMATTSFPVGAVMQVQARLVAGGAPLAGRILRFKYGSTVLERRKTNDAGVASAEFTIPKRGANNIVVEFDGGPNYGESRTTIQLTGTDPIKIVLTFMRVEVPRVVTPGGSFVANFLFRVNRADNGAAVPDIKVSMWEKGKAPFNGPGNSTGPAGTAGLQYGFDSSRYGTLFIFSADANSAGYVTGGPIGKSATIKYSA